MGENKTVNGFAFGVAVFVYWTITLFALLVGWIFLRRVEGHVVSIKEIRPGTFEVWYIKPKKGDNPVKSRGWKPTGVKHRLISKDRGMFGGKTITDANGEQINLGISYFTTQVWLWQ